MVSTEIAVLEVVLDVKEEILSANAHSKLIEKALTFLNVHRHESRNDRRFQYDLRLCKKFYCSNKRLVFSLI